MRGPPTMLVQITNHVTTRTPISHDITLGRRIGWAATISTIKVIHYNYYEAKNVHQISAP